MSDFRSVHSPRRLRRLRGPPNHPEKKEHLSLEGQLYGAEIAE